MLCTFFVFNVEVQKTNPAIGKSRRGCTEKGKNKKNHPEKIRI